MARTENSPKPCQDLHGNQSYLPEKFKVWCYQHTLYQQVMWLFKLSDITASTALQMDAKANISSTNGQSWCLNQLLRFAQEITSTSLQPEIVLWSSLTKAIIMVELSILLEDTLETAFERKDDKYAELATACSQAGRRAFTFPVEVECRGCKGTSAQRLFKSLGIRDMTRPCD